MTDTQKSTIANATSLAAAFDAAAAIDTTVNAVVQFTYGTDTYLFVNGVGGGTTYSATNDFLSRVRLLSRQAPHLQSALPVL